MSAESAEVIMRRRIRRSIHLHPRQHWRCCIRQELQVLRIVGWADRFVVPFGVNGSALCGKERLPGHTLLNFLISRTRFMNASSTLIRCLADVSMNLQPKCLARSRPSARDVQYWSKNRGMMTEPTTNHSFQLDAHTRDRTC